jgi:hypothetical protein
VYGPNRRRPVFPVFRLLLPQPDPDPQAVEFVIEAAKEAVQGVGFDLLLVCGLAFDPYVSEEAKRYGKLTVLPVRMNPDLSMGGDSRRRRHSCRQRRLVTGAEALFMA